MKNDNKKFIQFYKNKKVLITGHTGFKGSWLSAWLKMLNCKLYGLSLNKKNNSDHYKILNIKYVKEYFIDIANTKLVSDVISKIKPHIIFHMAAQPLVMDSYDDPIRTYKTNTLGVLNVLDAVKKINSKIYLIIITSDKVYMNNDYKKSFRENDILGGFDPYSLSKALSEKIIKNYFDNFLNNSKIKLAVGRAGNVIGGGDWSKNRILPDAFKSWNLNKALLIRNPKSTRPWQHVLDPLSGYILLAYKLSYIEEINGEAFNFGPNLKSEIDVLELIKKIGKNYHFSKIKLENKGNKLHESKFLALNCNKAKKLLNWKSTVDFKTNTQWTTEWYLNYYQNKKLAIKNTYSQIDEFMKKTKVFND